MATFNPQDFDDQSALRTFVQGLSLPLEDDLDRLVGFKAPEDGYFPPNSDWLLWAKKDKVIRLDVAVYAMHLAVARMLFKPMAHVVREKIQKTLVGVVKVGAWVGSLALLSHTVGFLFRTFIEVVGLWPEQEEQRTIEQSIRINMGKTMNDLHNDYMPQKRIRRRRRAVSSRHETPKQRRANG